MDKVQEAGLEDNIVTRIDTLESDKADTTHSHSEFTTAQFLPYSQERVYTTGETCYTKDQATGELTYWQWYSNIESLAGKNPLNPLNRQLGWVDDTKPFYWALCKNARAGTPLFPWMSMTFPEGTLNVLGNSVPVAVFWRLAKALPEFVNVAGGTIDFPETGGEFFRVLDQGRGIDDSRVLGSYQKGTLTAWDIGTDKSLWGVSSMVNDVSIDRIGADSYNTEEYPDILITGIGSPSSASLPGNQPAQGWSGVTRPRNLSFPILIEV